MEYIIALLGLCIGSFLNVCIYRLPMNMSVHAPRSHCMSCGNQLAAIDLIPIISFCLLKGRCRKCGATFSGRYALVELLTALLFVWCYNIFGLSFAVIPALVFTAFMIVITFIDFDYQLILDKVLIALAAGGLIFALAIDSANIIDRLGASLAGGALMLLIAIVSRGGMGGGDIKFVAALGLWLGMKYTFLMLFIAFILGGLSGVIVLLLQLKGRKDYIPFGPFIAAGAFISLLYGADIIAWYVRNYFGG